MAIATINPTTGETLKTFTAATDAEIDQAIAAAADAFVHYRQSEFSWRSQLMRRVADILEENKKQYAQLMTLEMGKPIKSAVAEVEKCAWVCRYYADHAQKFLADEVIETDASHSCVSYQPLGIVLAVMPWNFPFWQVFRFAAPTLMAGNVGLLKHASNVPQCALAIAEIFETAGFPDGVFQTLLIGASQVARVIEDDRVVAATLTGSEHAGASLASMAGKLIKKTVLELGGSDPYIVMPSANLDEAVNTAVTARLLNNGQSCIAAKRFILHQGIAETFTKRLLAKFKDLKVGDPMQEDTNIGPLATPQILEDLDKQVSLSIEKGAKALIGGAKMSDRPGNFYPPTILSEIPQGSPAYSEELFGPVASVFVVKDMQEAIALANNSEFGLGASAWTTDPLEQKHFMYDLQAGAVFINGMVKSDPRLPFGGIKKSGYGRELGVHGIREFVNIKTIWLK
jgi:succinate-semialdehyde dehydrogenase/glutarate-semialdehyde dehydrogenase